MISSKARAAIAPYSRWSSSRRSPGIPMTPIARPRPDVRRSSPAPTRPARDRRLGHHPLDEVGQLAHAVDVVAVVDDDPDAADVEQVQPTRRLEERRPERPQALADVVEVGARRPRRRGSRQRVGDVHPGLAAERRRDQVRVEQRHRPRPVAEHDQLALRRLLQHEGRVAAATCGRRPGRSRPRPSGSTSRRGRPCRRCGGPSGRRGRRRR